MTAPERILFYAYLALGPAAWAILAFLLFNGRLRMSLVKRPPRPLPPDPPPVSILVPAKDEEQRIADCLRSALGQDYPHAEVIAVNDRSTDGTGAIMDRLAAENPRLRVIHIRDGELPAGWTGKCNALHTAVGQARGRYLLFVDSDVVLKPDALSATMGYVLAKDVEVLSFLPALECHGLAESLLVPLAGAVLSVTYLVSLTNVQRMKRMAFANGQYLLFRRDAYDAIGGHAAVRDRFCEDMEFARRAKAGGHKIKVSWGAAFAAVRMYSSLDAIRRGWARIFYAASVGRPWRILGAALFLAVCGLGAYAALGWGAYRALAGAGTAWLAAAAAHVVLITAVLGIVYTWSGNHISRALLFPVGAGMMLGILWRAIRLCATGRLEWRGTQYGARTGAQQTNAPL